MITTSPPASRPAISPATLILDPFPAPGRAGRPQQPSKDPFPCLSGKGEGPSGQQAATTTGPGIVSRTFTGPDGTSRQLTTPPAARRNSSPGSPSRPLRRSSAPPPPRLSGHTNRGQHRPRSPPRRKLGAPPVIQARPGPGYHAS